MVRIICRIKPPKKDNIEMVSESKIYLYKRSKNLLSESIIKPYQFELDKFYDHDAKTQEIYDKEIKDKLKNNFGVFIYGHTGSGKTYTTFGNEDTKGIFDLISKDFDHTYELEAIDLRYNGNYDLFSKSKIILYSNGKEDNCYNTTRQSVTPENFSYIKSKILESRTAGKSKHNLTSSRSHLVIYIYKDNKKYTVVDLAGNERKPLMFDKMNEIETTFINSSLLALKECFRSYGKSYMPYRRSDLTRLLKDIINNKNLIICTIHSGFPYFYDSVDTLNYIYGLLNKVKSKPDFFERKIMPISPKILPKLNKKYILNNKVESKRKVVSPKLLTSPKGIIAREDNLSPKNIKYKDALEFSALDDLSPPVLNIDDIDNDENLFRDDLYNNDEFDEDEYEEIQDDDDDDEDEDDKDDDKEESNKVIKNNNNLKIDDNVIKMMLKDGGKFGVNEKNENDYKRIYKKIDMILKSSYDLKTKKKLLGIINNLMYKKIISNYKILLDDDFDESECTKLVFSTVSTLDICNQELLKILN